MTIAGIVCEYNPFHNGHKFHIEETRRLTKADAVVAVMSGNFVQRGDVAIFPKELRADIAVRCGADLVLELPTIYSMATAEVFAKGAVTILNALGSVNYLSFGAEAESIEEIMQIAKLLANEPHDFSSLLKDSLTKGKSYPSARADAVKKFLGDNSKAVLSTPNNILGIEYCKAIYNLNSQIVPVCVSRHGASHDGMDFKNNIASASYVRSLIYNNKLTEALDFVPAETRETIKDASVHSVKALETAIIGNLLKMSVDDLSNISDISEGLENRIKTAALTAKSFDELADAIKTKRYTHSRIRRILLSSYLGITKSDTLQSPGYIKILSHNQMGQKIISDCRKTALLPIVRNTSQINKLGDCKLKELWEKELTFDKLFKLSEI